VAVCCPEVLSGVSNPRCWVWLTSVGLRPPSVSLPPRVREGAWSSVRLRSGLCFGIRSHCARRAQDFKVSAVAFYRLSSIHRHMNCAA
jgi:hypothetical protein